MNTKKHMENNKCITPQKNIHIIALLFLILGIMFHSSSMFAGREYLNTFIFIFCIFISFLITLIMKILNKNDQIIIFFVLCSILFSYSIVTSFWSINREASIGASINMILPSVLILFTSIEIGKYLTINQIVKYSTISYIYIFIIFSWRQLFDFGDDRLKGMFDNSNQLGMLTAFIFIMFLNYQLKEKVIFKYIYYDLFLLFVIFSTFSRGSILMVGIALTIIVITSLKNSSYSQIKRFTILVSYLTVILCALIFVFGNRGLEIDRRFELFEIGKSLVNFQGHGYGTTGALLTSFGMPWFNSWHNSYIGLLVEGGYIWLIIGIFLMLYPIIMYSYNKKYLSYDFKIFWMNINFGIALAFLASQYFEFQMLRNTPLFYLFVFYLGIVTITTKVEASSSLSAERE